jgi:hypothetical protein
MILKLMIDIQDIRRFVLKTYLAAEPDALEDIVPIDVVVPLDAVQRRSRADHQRSLGSRGRSE